MLVKLKCGGGESVYVMIPCWNRSLTIFGGGAFRILRMCPNCSEYGFITDSLEPEFPDLITIFLVEFGMNTSMPTLPIF